MTEDALLTSVKGVGDKTAQLFKRRELITVSDMLHNYPRDYDAYEAIVPVAEATVGRMVALRLLITGAGTVIHAGPKTITRFQAADPTGTVTLAYFNMPYLKNTMKAGTVHVFRGILKQLINGKLVLDQPKSYSEEQYESLAHSLMPKYSLSAGMKNSQIVKVMSQIFKDGITIEDPLPEQAIERFGFLPYDQAIKGIHFPKDMDNLAAARNRLVFDEFFSFLLAVKKDEKDGGQTPNPRPMIAVADTKIFIEKLPYELTEAQLRSWHEIEENLSGPYLMNRLLQGDVGSGKTIVAFLALLMTACNKRQGAMMAPTEVLAIQHMNTLTDMVKEYKLPIKPVLLTGSVTGKARKEAYQSIANGEANVIIGTQALLQDPVEFKDLSLVITDEQHRFGVRQRESLAGKGNAVPVLVMSATPIPRTLAIILYGDLKVSLLDELPKDRLPIKNLVMEESSREKAYHFIMKQVALGRQAYIICPAVDTSETEDMENVTEYTTKLRQVMPKEITIGSLHGRMKPREKEEILSQYAAGDIDVLVSTTVIEVGINVPNASVMMVENSERFGLAQLHQLRGRVGRGKEQSYCIFLYHGDPEKKPKRLSVLEKSNDGFYIAEQDLKLRGPGDLFGIRQSGEMGFVLADIYQDAGMLEKASQYAEEILVENPSYRYKWGKSVDFRTI